MARADVVDTTSVVADAVKADSDYNSQYWRGYENTFVYRISDSAYESFLQGNGQTLGLKSYGACVDLLTHYYIAPARSA